MKFALDKPKAIEAIVFIASRMPHATPFYIAKAIYFAELEHLRRYGRPIFGDAYRAMDNGPVPSFAYDVLKDNVSRQDRELLSGAIRADFTGRHPTYESVREPEFDRFSGSDLECLHFGVDHVKDRSFGAISDETHEHAGWKNAELNSVMAPRDMLEGANPEIVELAEEFAAYGAV